MSSLIPHEFTRESGTTGAEHSQASLEKVVDGLCAQVIEPQHRQGLREIGSQALLAAVLHLPGEDTTEIRRELAVRYLDGTL